MESFKNSPLWIQAFQSKNDGLDAKRQLLITAFTEFRLRVSYLVNQIHKDMPSLTVHDITHLDALWWTASEIAGKDYPLNPAEAFVLGGAILLHDAAHCIAAYPGGIDEIRLLPEWTIFSARQGLDGQSLVSGTEEFQMVLFDVLRVMHPKQARRLAKVHWQAPGDTTPLYLLENDNLRRSYGDVIGQIAESHWFYPHELESLNQFKINPPSFLHPADWSVDILKLAILLRTADAAHIDQQRAPRFLLALVKPGNSSLIHWNFQSRMHEVKLDSDPERNDLRVSSMPFPASEQDAWWMAYDTARLIDNELRAADRLLLDNNRKRLSARSVAFSYSPEAFARNVPTEGWHPVDTSIKITDIKSMVERFGGDKLYGNSPSAALKELLQNSVDAIHACRSLGGLGNEEGEIEVALEIEGEKRWIHITDTGLGMSRYVLTDVLLDFGRSLWRSGDLQGEWQNLSASNFEAIGQFGIGFFSIFMLGERVRVLTRRYESKQSESPQWLLEFTAGTNKRPILREPSETERLKRHGTKVSVLISSEIMNSLCPAITPLKNSKRVTLREACAELTPALDINLFTRIGTETREAAIKANDWLTISPLDLLNRTRPSNYYYQKELLTTDWSNLSCLKDNHGNIKGRCSVGNSTSLSGYPRSHGIGSVKGVLAGSVPGLNGIVLSKPQTDLARKTSIPDITILELATWAEEQKIKLIDSGKIQASASLLLSRFGASPSNLIIGELAGSRTSREQLISKASRFDFFLIHDGEVTHEDEEDISKRNFQDDFEREDNLIEMTSVRVPDWFSQLDGYSHSVDTWTYEELIISALKEAWGDVVIDEDDTHCVGDVDGAKIRRSCRVARKLDIHDQDD